MNMISHTKTRAAIITSCSEFLASNFQSSTHGRAALKPMPHFTGIFIELIDKRLKVLLCIALQRHNNFGLITECNHTHGIRAILIVVIFTPIQAACQAASPWKVLFPQFRRINTPTYIEKKQKSSWSIVTAFAFLRNIGTTIQPIYKGSKQTSHCCNHTKNLLNLHFPVEKRTLFRNSTTEFGYCFLFLLPSPNSNSQKKLKSG
mmetsp:Transcript_11131/g.20672  ORF Transcript_11131/g.20672 Transcript_11131/m.20672 type:complete len:204 (+) Transcript_11131:3926-4537(+)